MINIYRLVCVLGILSFSINGFGQKVMSLQECVMMARTSSISIQKVDLSAQSSEISVQQAKAARYPNLNFSTTAGYNFGRTVDPSSNSFANTTIGFNQISLSTNVDLYNGGQNKNNIIKAQLDKQTALEDKKQIENDISLAVANLYLQILFAEENLDIQKNNLGQSDLQKQRLSKMVELGSRPAGDLANLDYQLAQNYQQIVTTENAIKSLYLDLKQSMNMPLDEEIIIAHPDINVEGIEVEALTFDKAYQTAEQLQPYIKSSGLKLQSAYESVKIAKGSQLPTVSLFGSISSNYSSLGKNIDGFDLVPFTQSVLIDNQPAEITSSQIQTQLSDAAYFDQINNNLGQSVGVRLSVPIYNKRAVKSSIERANLNLESLKWDDKENKNKLRKDITKAMLDIENAKSEYDAADLGLKAAVVLLDIANKKFDFGTLSTFELEDAKSKRDNAQLQLLMSKYKLLFNKAVLDFYLGRPLTIGAN